MQFRNRFACATVICFTSLIALSGAARADDRSDIEALFHKIEKAMSAKDVQGIVATGTKDFTYTEAGKTLNGEQVTAQLKQQFQAIPSAPKAKFTIVSCDIKGKGATVVAADNTVMQMPSQDGKAHTLVATGKSKLILVKTARGWLIKSETILSSKMSLDGKPFNPQAGAQK